MTYQGLMDTVQNVLILILAVEVTWLVWNRNRVK